MEPECDRDPLNPSFVYWCAPFEEANLACAAFTVSFSDLITDGGSSAPKIAVPATITLLPVWSNAKRGRGVELVPGFTRAVIGNFGSVGPDPR